MRPYNQTLLCDFYELTMGNGYLLSGKKDMQACFDLYFRKVPDNGGFAIAAGLSEMIEFLEQLHFGKEDIEYLRSKHQFSEEFLQYLADFKFECDVYAVPEGTPIFPNEPLVTVKGPAIQAQLLETMLLLTINHQSLIATKANRIVRAAQGRPVFEFGSRRAQGSNAAILGARAAFVGGCAGTACACCEQLYGIPAVGTMAHSWIQMYDSELEAFEAYARYYPDNCILLVDTYNVIKSGIPNAIKAYENVLKPLGKRLKGIRIDSGDITYLTKKVRKMLDAAGLTDCTIFISNSLDEYIIRDILLQGASIDSFGVGERLITSKSEPVFGGVYKLVATEKDGKYVPKIKLSENVEKITTPGYKKVYRLFSNETGNMVADLIALYDEEFDFTKPITLFDPVYTWKKKTFENYRVEEILKPIYEKGKLVYRTPTVMESKKYCAEQVGRLWDEVKRFENPQTYYVDLSQKLWDVKHSLLSAGSGDKQ
ncbi:MAG: nicotinate phosphoribosyltransferase [Eubacteriales bacterium]|nr:nicotinate phosphoribosyltransferase [Eubacteriales bacterium]